MTSCGWFLPQISVSGSRYFITNPSLLLLLYSSVQTSYRFLERGGWQIVFIMVLIPA